MNMKHFSFGTKQVSLLQSGTYPITIPPNLNLNQVPSLPPSQRKMPTIGKIYDLIQEGKCLSHRVTRIAKEALWVLKGQHWTRVVWREKTGKASKVNEGNWIVLVNSTHGSARLSALTQAITLGGERAWRIEMSYHYLSPHIYHTSYTWAIDPSYERTRGDHRPSIKSCYSSTPKSKTVTCARQVRPHTHCTHCTFSRQSRKPK